MAIQVIIYRDCRVSSTFSDPKLSQHPWGTRPFFNHATDDVVCIVTSGFHFGDIKCVFTFPPRFSIFIVTPSLGQVCRPGHQTSTYTPGGITLGGFIIIIIIIIIIVIIIIIIIMIIDLACEEDGRALPS